MNYSILRYRSANYEANYLREYYASKLLIDDGIGYRSRPARCIFRTESAGVLELALHWQHFDQLNFEWDTAQSKPEQFTFETLDKSITWLRLPTFMPNDEQLAKLEAMNQWVAAKKFGSNETIVFDLRGNRGGQGAYGISLLLDIYGEHAARVIWESKYAEQEKDTRSQWRVSEGNYEHIVAKRDLTENAVVKEMLNKLIDEMEKAIKSGEQFIHPPSVSFFDEKEHVADINIEDVVKNLPNVILLTDRFCGSACLNVFEIAMSIPKVIHVGRETFADTQYNELRDVMLPSGLGDFYFIMAVFPESRGPFKPEHRFDGDMNDSEALKKWVTENIVRIKEE